MERTIRADRKAKDSASSRKELESQHDDGPQLAQL